MARGLFLGMITLDVIYHARRPPGANEKLMAEEMTLAAGGPACNAAVTFAWLGNEATVAGAVGRHPLTQLIRADLAAQRVQLADITPDTSQAPPVSSVVVSRSNGDRSVISRPAIEPEQPCSAALQRELRHAQVVLLDGHQLAASQHVIRNRPPVPIVVDVGSFKPGFEEVLPNADYVLCSTAYAPAGCAREDEVLTHLADLGVRRVAITHGCAPITVVEEGHRSEVPVPRVNVVDTLAAGDVFHGAFCHFILSQSFAVALARAAEVAALSCQSFGTRSWHRFLDETAQPGSRQHG